jgi:hypothetical protein
MFRSSTIIRELVLCLAKVMLEHSVKLCPYRSCGGVAACLGVACVLCAVQNEIASLFDRLKNHEHVKFKTMLRSFVQPLITFNL